MFSKKLLCCSFCGKDEKTISKLVAGPKVYICDECVAIAAEIMQSHGSSQPPSRPQADSLWVRVRKLFADQLKAQQCAVSGASNARVH